MSSRDGSLDASRDWENLTGMPTLLSSSSERGSRKGRAVAKRKGASKGPSFGEWARRVAGLVKSARKDLSTIEGFGDFKRVTRGVLKTRKPAVVRTPKGLVQIAPYALAEKVPPASAGSLKPLPREIELSNTFGDTL